MKRILCFIITAMLVLSLSSVALAKPNHEKKQHGHQNKQEQRSKGKNSIENENENEDSQDQEVTAAESRNGDKHFDKDTKDNENDNEKDEEKDNQKQEKNHEKKSKSIKQEFKINGSPVIKYGRYKLPIRPITQGMGATVTFDETTAVLTVAKGATTIVINFNLETVTVNGINDPNSGIFTVENNKKSIVLIKYIAKTLGVRANCNDDKVTVEVPGLDSPTNITVTPIGTNTVANTINRTTTAVTGSAIITPNQATGGRAELYVGNKLIATDNVITATDSTVTFTTSSSTNVELQTMIPNGGVISVKLYNANNEYVISKDFNLKLIVDYSAPMVAAFNSAVCNVTGSAITINVSGAGAVGDKVDVTKISLYDTSSGRYYQLTNTPGIGSTGVVVDKNTIVITLGSADKLALAGIGNTTVFLNIAQGSLLYDSAGNTSLGFASIMNIPVIVIR